MNALLLLALALTEAAFAGFRASAGRDGRIRKNAANAVAAKRGIAVAAPALALTAALACVLLLTAGSPTDRYAELDAAARRMLLVLVPYATAVVVSLACYLWAPFRASTLATVVGLGPLTLLRPVVVLAAAAAAAWDSLPAAVVAVAAAAAVLLVEPLTHRRWYAAPL
ncbi:hypothetical protein [Streptomyces sp. NPDC020681]|uniref:hypothetical protein n=1 Tax=Streptomyces sp. NPDC020681 TaxID=3365083 RepID=UPI0037A06548